MTTDSSTETTPATDDTITSDDRRAALASYAASCGTESPEIAAGYSGAEFFVDGGYYRILTDDEADEAARAAVMDSLWAFNTSFLSSYIEELDDEGAAKAFDDMLCRLCESANSLVRRILGDRLEECVDDAISCDGRGPFLAGYDLDEREHVHNGRRWYIYRTN